MARRAQNTQNRTPQRARAKRAAAGLFAALRTPGKQQRTLMGQARFLVMFRQCGNVLRSAQAVGIGRRTVYDWLQEEAFKRLYDEAHEDALDILEEEARRRAVDGVEEPVVSAGKLVTTVRRYSDTLLIALLKAKRPETFRDRIEHTGKNGRPITVEAIRAMTDGELKARALDLIAKM